MGVCEIRPEASGGGKRRKDDPADDGACTGESTGEASDGTEDRLRACFVLRSRYF